MCECGKERSCASGPVSGCAGVIWMDSRAGFTVPPPIAMLLSYDKFTLMLFSLDDSSKFAVMLLQCGGPQAAIGLIPGVECARGDGWGWKYQSTSLALHRTPRMPTCSFEVEFHEEAQDGSRDVAQAVPTSPPPAPTKQTKLLTWEIKEALRRRTARPGVELRQQLLMAEWHRATLHV